MCMLLLPWEFQSLKTKQKPKAKRKRNTRQSKSLKPQLALPSGITLVFVFACMVCRQRWGQLCVVGYAISFPTFLWAQMLPRQAQSHLADPQCSLLTLILLIICECVQVCISAGVQVCVCQSICVEVRWSPGLELRLSGLAASVLTHWAIQVSAHI